MEQAEDIDFLLRFLEYARGANFTEPLYVYRIHTASISSQYGRNAVDRKSQIIFANLKKHFPDLVISFDQAKQVSDALLGRSNTLY